MARVLGIVAIVTAHAVRFAQAGGCPPAVALSGEESEVRAVREALDARGIAGETPSCPALHAHVERQGAQLVVRIEPGEPAGEVVGLAGPGAGIERAVGEPSTAATVIESWVRRDVAAPLLETRAVVEDEPAAAVGAGRPAATGTQLFAAAETSLASDRTVWQGLQLGVCVMFGPICAAARIHGGKVIAAPGGWDHLVRKGGAVYGGVDVPIAIGRTRLSPGFSAGYGMMLTRSDSDPEHTGIEISGPRAEAHVALSIPVTPRLAIELATSAELTQATGVETHGNPTSPASGAVVYPDEPRALFRFAIGVRYGVL